MKHLKKGLDYLYKKTDVDKPDMFAKQNIRPKTNKLSFQFQDNPIQEVGVNGIQISDMLYFLYGTIASLNGDYPCDENIRTLEAISSAIMWQDRRKEDRLKREVEGLNKV